MTSESFETDLRTAVRRTASAFLHALGLKSDAPTNGPLWVEISFEGLWPVYIDASAMLRDLAGGIPLVCHTTWRPTLGPAAPLAVVFRTLDGPGAPAVRPISFIAASALVTRTDAHRPQ